MDKPRSLLIILTFFTVLSLSFSYSYAATFLAGGAGGRGGGPLAGIFGRLGRI